MVDETNSETKITEPFDPIISLTLPALFEFRHRLPANIEQLCRKELPVYSDDVQTRCVTVEQRTDEWHKLRANRLTGSNFGSAAGHNKYNKPDQLLRHLLWPETNKPSSYGLRAMDWGTQNENKVRDLYLQYLRKLTENQQATWFLKTLDPSLLPEVADAIQEYIPMTELELLINKIHAQTVCKHDEVVVIEIGMCISRQYPWLGASPDGLICQYHARLKRFFLLGLLEIKCPWQKDFYTQIPPYYYDQVQGFMNMFDIPWCDFVTWIPSPDSFRVDGIVRNDVYWSTDLFPKLQTFYFGRYLPFKILQQYGCLAHNSVAPVFAWE